jgi:hypothetical protein
MSSDAPFTAVREMLEAQWSGAALVWPNEGLEVADSSMPWIYMDMSGNDMAAMELGPTAAYAERGVIFAHLMCPVGTGTLELRAIAKQLSNLFRQANIPGMTFGRQSLGSGEIGDDDGLWFRQSFTCEYVYQDVFVE